MYGRKGLEPLAMPMAAWLAWLESASSMWSAMSIPATAPARLKELLQINGRLIAERDALLAAAGTLMSHDRKSQSCKPSHRRRSTRATRLPSDWRRSSGSPRLRNASWMTRDRRPSPAQPKCRRTSRPERWRGQSSRSCSKKFKRRNKG